MKITMVKKILKDGSPCKKCAEIQNKLEESGHIHSIDDVVIADERDEHSPGMLLAKQHQVDKAPFFIVENESGEVEIYTVYFKLVKEHFK